MIIILGYIIISDTDEKTLCEDLVHTAKRDLCRIVLRHFSSRTARIYNFTRGVFVFPTHVRQSLQKGGTPASWLSQYEQHLSRGDGPREIADKTSRRLWS